MKKTICTFLTVIAVIFSIFEGPSKLHEVMTFRHKFTPYGIECYVDQLPKDNQLFEYFDNRLLTIWIWSSYESITTKEILKKAIELDFTSTLDDIGADSKVMKGIMSLINPFSDTYDYTVYDDEMKKINRLVMSIGENKMVKYRRENNEGMEELSSDIELEDFDNNITGIVLEYSSNPDILKINCGRIEAIKEGKAKIYFYTGDYVKIINAEVKKRK